jgi:hypothetical protein
MVSNDQFPGKIHGAKKDLWLIRPALLMLLIRPVLLVGINIRRNDAKARRSERLCNQSRQVCCVKS